MVRTETSQVPRRLIDLLSGRYAFVSVLGRGGSGVVYEVRNVRLGRLEALKVLTNTLSDDTTKRFVQEARVCASLDHPGIVRVYDFGHLEGVHWYSMQLINGPSLAAIIDAGTRLDVNGFAKLAIPLMDALAYSHRNGVVHRDIKPANIMLLSNGTPCLTDFGIAKSADSLDFTQTSNVLGTPAYMSPEQADGTQVDGRTDQYSLAITFYRAITGRLPFSSVGPVETLVQRLKEDPEPIDWHYPDFPVPLKHVLMKALSRDREDRYPTIESMKKSMLTACEACHVAWQEPFSLKGLEHLTAQNRKPIEPIEPGEPGLDDDMETMTSTMSAHNAKAHPRNANVVAWIALGAVSAFFFWWVLQHYFKPLEPPAPPSQGPAQASEGAQPESSVQPPAPPPQFAPISGKTVVESKLQAPAKKRAFIHPILKSRQAFRAPHEIAQSFAAMGLKGISLIVTVGADGSCVDYVILGKPALTHEQRRFLDEAVGALKFDPAEADDGDPVPDVVTLYFPFVED